MFGPPLTPPPCRTSLLTPTSMTSGMVIFALEGGDTSVVPSLLPKPPCTIQSQQDPYWGTCPPPPSVFTKPAVSRLLNEPSRRQIANQRPLWDRLAMSATLLFNFSSLTNFGPSLSKGVSPNFCSRSTDALLGTISPSIRVE